MKFFNLWALIGDPAEPLRGPEVLGPLRGFGIRPLVSATRGLGDPSQTPRQRSGKRRWATHTENLLRLLLLQTPRPATGVSRALRARSVPRVSFGASLGLFGPRAPECPKSVPRVSPSVPRVSPECSGHLFDTLGTLSGRFLDTPEPGARRAPETPRRTLPGHFGPEGPERTSVAGRGVCNTFRRSESDWRYYFVRRTYSAIGFRGKLFLRHPFPKPVFGLQYAFFKERSGGVAAIVCDTTGNTVRQGYCYTCLAIGGGGVFRSGH